MTFQEWADLVGEVFRMEDAPGLDLKLARTEQQASERLKAQLRPNERVPFSLEFHGPREPILPQQVYALKNKNSGRIEIFLVPVGQEADHTLYEAVFN